MINEYGCNPSALRSGHQGADFHSGTIKVPSSPPPSMCLKTLGIKAGGGNNQLFSFFHEMVKASIPSVAGLSHFELNLGICLERNDANLSTVCGPHNISKAAKILVFNI